MSKYVPVDRLEALCVQLQEMYDHLPIVSDDYIDGVQDAIHCINLVIIEHAINGRMKYREQ